MQRETTDGYGTEDLVIRTVEVTDKLDKDGKPVKVTKWNLKYPETIVPIEEVVAETPVEVAETTDTAEPTLAPEVAEPEYPNLD